MTRSALTAIAVGLLVVSCANSSPIGEVEPTDAAPDYASTGGATSCAVGLPGPNLIKLAAPDGSAYCMDQREVTLGEYAAFAKAANVTKQIPECEWNDRFEPDLIPPVDPQYEGMPGVCHAEDYDPVGEPDRAVSCVDWCDAAAYCAWAGKRLCGTIGGGGSLDAINDPTKSEVKNACTEGGKTKFPWGDTYTPGTCIDSTKLEQLGPTAKNVTKLDGSACHGATDGFAEVYDLVGSVLEWSAECEAPGKGCALHGFPSMYSTDQPSCDAVASDTVTTHREYGFRCCADVLSAR